MRSTEYLRKKCPRLGRSPTGFVLAAIGLTSPPAAFFACRAVFSHGSQLIAAATAAVFLLTLLVSCLVLLDHRHFVSIHPYFGKPPAGERPVSSGACLLSGRALAQNLEPLDTLAEELCVSPISAFGFADDFFGEQVTWHPPEQGLKTVSALLDSLAEQPDRVPDSQSVTKDLKKIADALENARKRNIRFSLVVRATNATNPMEWEQRQGTA